MLALFRVVELILAVLLFVGVSVASDTSVTLSAEDNLPDWASKSTLQMELSTDSTNYAIIPLTEGLGLGGSEVERQLVQIKGYLKATKGSNYREQIQDNDIAYMSCDKTDSSTDPMTMLNGLMAATPKAIVLYTTSSNWCFIDHARDLPYPSILSMVDPAEAIAVLGHLNQTKQGDTVEVSIYGNTTDIGKPVPPGHGGGKSRVAMSILYSITGIITLLFILIIVTGAVRAHRYPERYGPRRGDGDRPPQSRAKGLAKAVLETIPIVKFGDRGHVKPDPDLELEIATTDGRETPAQRAMSHSSEQRQVHTTEAPSIEHRASSALARESESLDLDMRCSICTDDFKVGEDVRVLPCNHQFHPNCIDPWLINVSGTCPLCRLDLRPGHGSSPDSGVVEGETPLPPPLGFELGEHDGVQASSRNRFSRIFDINRLRQASVEEQMEALRQLREDRIGREDEGREAEGPLQSEEEECHQGARFADKLKDRFRILTKSQSALRREP